MATATSGCRVLVVDDDPALGTLVSLYLQRDGHRTLYAADGSAALELARAHSIDLMILDVMLPGLSGTQVARIVKDQYPLPILMLSARTAVADRVRGLDSGADDYLGKPFEPAELLARVRALVRRTDPPRAEDIIPYADLVVDRGRRTVVRGGAPVEFTSLEFDLLNALLAAQGRVLTRDALLDAIQRGCYEPILDRSIDAYVARLRRKLDDDARRPRYIETVHGVGYRARGSGLRSAHWVAEPRSH